MMPPWDDYWVMKAASWGFGRSSETLHSTHLTPWWLRMRGTRVPEGVLGVPPVTARVWHPGPLKPYALYILNRGRQVFAHGCSVFVHPARQDGLELGVTPQRSWPR